MNILKKLISTILFLITLCTIHAQHAESSYEVIYSTDNQGNQANGSLEQLIGYVKSGSPVRVGWVLEFPHPITGKLSEMQHWTDAGFITMLDGQIFAQISSIYEQAPGFESPPNVYLVSAKAHGWVAVIGTTGVMRQKYNLDSMRQSLETAGMSKEEIESTIKAQETMKVKTMWAVPLAK